MNTDKIPDFDDLGEALRENRAFRPARGYRIRFANSDLDFHFLIVKDPVPLGRQILEAGKCDPRDGYSLFAILPSGDFEDIRLDEPYDLRGKGAERFIAFKSDREYKIELNERQLKWGKPTISGAVLYSLAKVKVGESVFLEVPGGEDQLIEPEALVNLNDAGIERFITAPTPSKRFEIIVNSQRHLVEDSRVTFEQVGQLAFPGQQNPNNIFSVTFRHVASKPHSGELGAGGFVEVKAKGSIFNVTRTIQS